MSYLDKINSPSDLKKLRLGELERYAEEVRGYIIEVVNKNGGHMASSLGAVDFTIALHYVFDCPTDKIIFDVGHQSYAHKIITGRRDAFQTIRTPGGITGFENMSESDCDAFSTGHSSTSLSAALGMARARDLAGEKYNVVSIIGDGALTGGMAYEALNDIGASKTKMIIVLNDNTMSISKNVGAISAYLARLRLSKRYKVLKTTFRRGIDGLPLLGRSAVRVAERAKTWIKKQLSTNKMFEQLGIKYYGVFDGHNIGETVNMLMQLKNDPNPVILHLLTNKGNGLYEAEKDPEKYHGVEGSHEDIMKYSAVAGKKLVEMAERDDKVVAVTAAMMSGTGIAPFCEAFPSRVFDVGIAEQHAVTMCAGFAAVGYKPYFAVYSSFLQRGFDQLLHDVCINKLPVRFLIDRAGAAGSDGVTHQGLFDLSYLSMLPDMTVLAPRNGDDLEKMLEWSLEFNGPLAIRYPKGYHDATVTAPLEYGKWERIKTTRSKVTVLAVGNRMVGKAVRCGANVVSARFVKPIDVDMLQELNREGELIVTLEDNILRGGFGQSVLSYLSEVGLRCAVKCLGFPDEFCHEMSVADAFEKYGLTVDCLKKIVSEYDG